MTITLFHVDRGSRDRSDIHHSNRDRASALRALCVGSSLVFTLACSGGDSSDDPVVDETADDEAPSVPSSGPSDDERTPVTPGGADEDGPNVTDIDESTAPRGPGAGDEAAGDPDQEAAGMSTLPGSDAAESSPEVPASDVCAAVADWDPEWVQFEEEVLLLVNEFRSEPADCGVEGQFEAAPPLSMNPILRCSARLHSLDMFERNYFEHDTPDGIDPFERMAEAGFVGSGGGENIAFGQRTPEEVMDAWMESDGHCANVMRAAFDTIGVGYHPGSTMRGGNSNYWTQNFGAPAFMRGGNRR